MKSLFLVVFWGFFSLIQSQNCDSTSVGFPPINDLGMGFFQGLQGGLYPNGSNSRPQNHNQVGLAIANNMQPLDAAGNPDPINGKIVLISIGMSNTSQEFQEFFAELDTVSNLNTKLKVVNGAQGGEPIGAIIDPNAPFWGVVNDRLASQNVTPQQVQVFWFLQAEERPQLKPFLEYVDSLKEKFKVAIQIAKSKFPNLKMGYLSSRIYAGYANTTLNPEPFAYYSGWSVKRLIEDQINGDSTLAFSEPNAKVPWLSWGPYLWADGLTPRSDGLIWVCPDDFETDGTHPSVTSGRQKVAGKLIKFFKNDETAQPWFLENVVTSIDPTFITDSAQLDLKAHPNPFNSTISFTYNLKTQSKVKFEIYNLLGQRIITLQNGRQAAGIHQLKWAGRDGSGRGVASGIFIYRINVAGKNLSGKIILVK